MCFSLFSACSIIYLNQKFMASFQNSVVVGIRVILSSSIICHQVFWT